MNFLLKQIALDRFCSVISNRWFAFELPWKWLEMIQKDSKFGTAICDRIQSSSESFWFKRFWNIPNANVTHKLLTD